MKIFLATVFLTVIAATVFKDCDAYLSEAAIKRTQQMLKKICTKKFSIEENVFDDIKKGIFPENNNDLKCYFACNFKTMQLVDPKGFLDKKVFTDKMKLLAPPSVLAVLLPAIGHCVITEKGVDYCQSSYNFIKCSHRFDPHSLDYLPI